MHFDMTLTTCPFCGTGCNFYLQVQDEEIVDVVPCRSHAVSQEIGRASCRERV